MTNEIKEFTLSRAKLEGEVRISGAKNSVLRLLAASLLTEDPITIENYPESLLDAQVHEGMLEALGKSCESKGAQTLSITENSAPPSELAWDGRSIRNTLLILGALVTRTGKGRVPLPGGCKLGERKYDIHVQILEDLGAKVWDEGDFLCAEVKEGVRLKGSDVHLPMRSTGATENALIMASLAEGTTRIWGPHVRPEIFDLIKFLSAMGAKIETYGQESFVVHGVEKLSGTKHRVIPDNVEALTWLVGAAVTDGDVEIIDFPFEHLEIPLINLRESGARFYRSEDRMIVRGGRCFPLELSTGPYPGINSDMQPLMAVYGAQAEGESRIIDLRFPGRYAYAEELAKMGIRYEVRENLLIIKGRNPWKGATVTALDLRAGAALLLAGLNADGETKIQNAWQIFRGYDRLPEKLRKLGVTFSTKES